MGPEAQCRDQQALLQGTQGWSSGGDAKGTRSLQRASMPRPGPMSETLVPGTDGWQGSLQLPYDSPVRQVPSPPSLFEHGETEAQAVKSLPKAPSR